MKGANPQVTAFMDWSDEELIALGELCVNYSGVATLYEGVDVIQNEYYIELPINKEIDYTTLIDTEQEELIDL